MKDMASLIQYIRDPPTYRVEFSSITDVFQGLLKPRRRNTHRQINYTIWQNKNPLFCLGNFLLGDGNHQRCGSVYSIILTDTQPEYYITFVPLNQQMGRMAHLKSTGLLLRQIKTTKKFRWLELTITKDMTSFIRYIHDPPTQWAEFFIHYGRLSGVVIPGSRTPAVGMII